MHRRPITVLALAFLTVTAGCTAIPMPVEPQSTPAPGDGTRVTVVRVVDGDTMDVRFENGSTERVRLLGVDTPETHGAVSPGEWEGVPDSAGGRACLEDWGDRASDFATRELAGETVTLVVDPQSDVRGGYGRLLGYLAYDGTTINRRLLETGHARLYDTEFSRRAEYAALERDARANETGAWTCRTPSSGDERGETNASVPLSISVHADADGPDGDNLNDEYVSLTNTGDDALDLAGWTITDAADHTYTFADAATIDAKGTLVLHTGSGTDSATDVYWNAGSPVWNNDGDTVTVRNASGAVVARTAY